MHLLWNAKIPSLCKIVYIIIVLGVLVYIFTCGCPNSDEFMHVHIAG